MPNTIGDYREQLSTALKPLRTGLQLGSDKFFALFDRPVSISSAAIDRPTYGSLRGMFIPRVSGAKGYDETRKFEFQFNPGEMDFSKTPNYSVRSYTGFDYVDYMWANGGEREVTFTLFLDATAGFYHSYFRKTAAEVSASGKADSVYAAVKELAPKGLLPQLDLLRSFTSPAVPNDKGNIIVPAFSTGGIVESKQFYPPPILIFSYGPVYLEGFLKDAPHKVTLFDKELNPVRAEVQVTFTVMEQRQLTIKEIK